MSFAIIVPNILALIALGATVFLVVRLLRLHRAKQKMEIEQRQLNTIFSAMGEGVMAVDVKARILLMNQAAGAALRIAPSEAEGKSIADVLTLSIKGMSLDFRADLTRFMQSIDIIRAGVGDNYMITRRDGKAFPVAMIVTPFFEGTKVLGAIILFHDITRDKEIDEAKNEFVSFASHQLRTPLGSMRWNMEMLLENAFGEIHDDTRQVITDMLASDEFLIGLVNKLLDISRIEEGKTKTHPVPTDGVGLIKSLIKRLEGDAQSHKISLILTEPQEQMPKISADPDQFTEAITNLISNAIKYNKPEGSVKVQFAREGNNMLLTITDNGIGIPEEDRTRVFSKFYRASNAASGSVHGTGLGLFMVKLYIERSGGKIRFESEVNKGTTFYISMPLAAPGEQ
jgi:PAS domain S-box-containing protein